MELVRAGGNLYREGINGWLGLTKYQLPTPKVKTETHHPGGGIMELEVPVGAIEPLELQFNTRTAHPELNGGIGLELHQASLYTIYELLQDIKTGKKRERIITLRGLYSEVNPEEMAGRGVKGFANSIRSITEYEDFIEGYGTVARYSFWTNTWSGYGITVGNDDNRILRISG